MVGRTFWLVRPSLALALGTAAAVALLASVVALGAARVSPFTARSHLALASGKLDEIFLTPLQEDPARVLLTTQRQNSTWSRDQSAMAGDPYWVRRYADSARPGLPQRILLTSRSRGAHLFVPLGALDLERALAERVDERQPQTEDDEKFSSLRCSLAQVFWSRSFAGVFLHLRFPERMLVKEGPDAGEPLDFDLVVVRGNELRTTDFLLQPNGQLYRSALADGLMPAGPFRRNPGTGDESIVLMREVPAGAELQSVPLYSPVSLFDELGLCWETQLPTVVDDRWRLDAAPAYQVHPPSAETRANVFWNGTLHLAARLEPEEERRALEQALARFSDS